MSAKQAIHGSTHVVKTTASLNFFSNATKTSTTSAHLHAVDVTKFQKPKQRTPKPRLVRSSVRPFHPFLNASETYKLLLVCRSWKPPMPLVHQATMSNGEEVVESSLTFENRWQALKFGKDLNEEFFELEVLSCVDADLSGESIDENIRQTIETKLDGDITVEMLDDVFKTPLSNLQGLQITNEEKVAYVIDRYLRQSTAHIIFKAMEKYIIASDTAGIALKTFGVLRQCSKRLKSRKSVVFGLLQRLHDNIVSTYPELSQSMELKISYLDVLLRYNKKEPIFTILNELCDEGFTPDATMVARYLDVLAHDSYISVMSNLDGLRDVVFTTIDEVIAEKLIKKVRSVVELSSLVDLLEARHSKEELTPMLKTLEPSILMTLEAIPANSEMMKGTDGDAVLPMKLALLNRMGKYISWSAHTKLFIIKESIKVGSFVYARLLLEQIDLTKETLDELKMLAEGLDLIQNDTNEKKRLHDGRPGRDTLSYQEFMSVLAEK